MLFRSEIKELPSILWEDEKVEKITSGMYNNGNGILVATNKRLIFVDKGMLYGLRVEDFPYEKITSIQYEIGLLMGKITIFASGNRADITHAGKASVRGFSEHVRARITPASNSVAPAKAEDKQDDFIAKLERLADLKKQGILTEEEFLQQKSRILHG